MTKQSKTPLRKFLKKTGIRQADLARGIHRTTGYVSQLVNGITGASEQTHADILVFSSKKLGRPVTDEEVFGSPLVRRRVFALVAEGKR